MSMQRSIARNIARNRLKDAGYDRPNKRLGMSNGGKSGYIDTVMSQRKGRRNSRMAKKFEAKLRASDPPVWKRVVFGDLKKKFEEASKRANLRRGLAIQARKVHRGEAWQTTRKGATGQ